MAIAGFVQPSSGEILLDGRPITRLPPEAREFGVVFQGYALFPHMTVAENVAYPLKVRRIAPAERTARVRETLGARATRRISATDGRRSCRAASSSAWRWPAPSSSAPNLLLLDEPLSALDKNLRTELQIELKRLHARIGTTFVNVTHDQEEAITLSDRIAIMRGGRLMQMGSPAELFERPGSKLRGGFPRPQQFPGRAGDVDGECGDAGLSRRDPCIRRGRQAGRPRSARRRCWRCGPNKIMLLAAGEDAPNVVTGRITTGPLCRHRHAVGGGDVLSILRWR